MKNEKKMPLQNHYTIHTHVSYIIIILVHLFASIIDALSFNYKKIKTQGIKPFTSKKNKCFEKIVAN